MSFLIVTIERPRMPMKFRNDEKPVFLEPRPCFISFEEDNQCRIVAIRTEEDILKPTDCSEWANAIVSF